MKQTTVYFLLVGLRIAAADDCPGPAAGSAPADPAHAASGVVMLATKSVVSKNSLLADSEGTTISADTKGIETEAALITKVLETPRDSHDIQPALLEGLAKMKITPQVAAFIKATLKTLQPVFGNITEASVNATNMCNTMHASFGDLDASLNSTKARVKSLETAANTKRKDHSDCRTAESDAVVAKEACDLEETVLKQKLKVAVVEVQAQQGETQTTVCGTSKNDVTVGSKDLVKKFKDKASAMAKAGNDFLEIEANTTSKVKECVGLADDAANKKTECNQKQVDVETAVCRQGSAAEDGCKVYESIFQTRLNDYQTVVQNVALQQADRLSEWKHLKRIECVLEAIGSAKAHGDLKANGTLHSRIEACYGKPFHNAGLIVAPKPPPLKQSCPAVPELPCTASFVSQEYGNMPTKAPAATCSNWCAATTTTTITTTITTTEPGVIVSSSCKKVRVSGAGYSLSNGDYADNGAVNGYTMFCKNGHSGGCSNDSRLYWSQGWGWGIATIGSGMHHRYVMKPKGLATVNIKATPEDWQLRAGQEGCYYCGALPFPRLTCIEFA